MFLYKIRILIFFIGNWEDNSETPNLSEIDMEDVTENIIPDEVPETEASLEMSPLPEPLPTCSSWSTYSPALLRTPRAPQLEVCMNVSTEQINIVILLSFQYFFS